jgi:nicotinamidase-related amidase
MTQTHIIEQATEFLQALTVWEQQIPTLAWSSLQTEAKQGRVALFSVDMINGFCTQGPLASPRVQGIAPVVVSAFENAFATGVRDFLLLQDCHAADAPEFTSFPPHCVAGTSEAETIPELAQLPFANTYRIFPKNSLDAFHNSDLAQWEQVHSDLSVAVIIGDCTDLCVYSTAMHLKLHANAHNRKLRVIVPANAVQTYDMPIETAKQLSALPHNGDVLHLMYLYQMQLNGIEVVREMIR